MKPDDNEERRAERTLLCVPAFTFATISDAAPLEHPSSEQKMRGVFAAVWPLDSAGHRPLRLPPEVQVANRKIEHRSLIRAAF
jgi:hypothetical protein